MCEKTLQPVKLSRNKQQLLALVQFMHVSNTMSHLCHHFETNLVVFRTPEQLLQTFECFQVFLCTVLIPFSQQKVSSSKLFELIRFYLVHRYVLPSKHSLDYRVQNKRKCKLLFISDHVAEVSKKWCDFNVWIALEKAACKLSYILEPLSVITLDVKMAIIGVCQF